MSNFAEKSQKIEIKSKKSRKIVKSYLGYNVGMEEKLAQLESLLNDSEVVERLENMSASSGGWKPSSDADDLMEMIIADSCGGKRCASTDKLEKGGVPYSVEYLAKNLPAVQFVAQFYLELIAHGGLVAQNDYNQKKLDAWLADKNILGQSNANVIREGVLNSIIYGYSGIRLIGDGIVYVSPDQFTIWKLPGVMKDSRGHFQAVPGITRPFLYEIGTAKTSLENQKNRGGVISAENEAQAIKDQGLERGVDGSYYPKTEGVDSIAASNVYVPTHLFCHLRHSDEGEYGVSPLSTDRLRTTLIIDYLRNVIDEVGNDGTDYMLYLKRKNNIGTSLAGLVANSAASAALSAAVDAKNVKNAQQKTMETARELAAKMKRSKKTRMNIINTNFIDKVERLPGTVELSQYLTILNDAKGVIADIYGIPAMLAGSSGGGWSTGMSSLIPFTLERTIKPFQKRYSEQLQEIIARASGVKGEIRFKEVDTTDAKAIAEIEKIRSEKLRNLEEANKKKAEALKIMRELEEGESSDSEKE